MRKILLPETDERAYFHAGEAFQRLHRQITGETLEILTRDDGISDLIVIGSDAVNALTERAFQENWLDTLSIRYGTDDYALRSVSAEGRSFLILAGGRGRSTLYAVYDYFERIGGCRYFWDGDVIPQRDFLPIEGLAVAESPRFQYRGLRYFAHRGLHRFQAEHWSLSDWEREIDWLVKRRMNFMMLRIGIDDVFQQAFPDVVPYPDPTKALSPDEAEDTQGPHGKGYDDRTLFWPLEFRGMLRKQIQRYARERDLLHPEDCGTMTHWYSRTPLAYLEKKKPPQLTQADCQYTQRNGLCWNPHNRENMENYFRLTDAYCSVYGEPRLFHTIGLAERMFSKDRRENMNLKLFTYRRILQKVYERYPDAKTMIASWDFLVWWKPEEVRRLMQELDPERTLILDYTSEGDDPEHCFLNWGFYEKFPWIFGIFQAYERQSSIRGPYDLTAKRLEAAKNDSFCKGMIYWPELSHSDTLALEYLARNSWQPEQLSIEKMTESFSRDRYGAYAETMNAAWQAYLPLVKLFSWGGGCTRKQDDPLFPEYGNDWQRYGNFMSDMLGISSLREMRPDEIVCWRHELDKQRPFAENPARILSILAELDEDAASHAFVRRDVVDIARSVMEQRIHHGIMALLCGIADYRAGAENAEQLRKQMDACLAAARCHLEIISCHEDYSMQATLEGLAAVCPVNPAFEQALKRNLVNSYCRQAAYEPERYLFIPENEAYYDWVRGHLAAGNRDEWTWTLEETEQALYQRFMDTPLAQMRPLAHAPLKTLLEKAAREIAAVSI